MDIHFVLSLPFTQVISNHMKTNLGNCHCIRTFITHLCLGSRMHRSCEITRGKI
jgi:hypothetical protein